jgi:signal transduction histidine kinase
MAFLLPALPILTISVTLFLGLLVLLSDRRNKINRTFSILTFWVAIWIFTVFMADYAKDIGLSLFWTRMSIIGPAIFSPILVYFSLIFPFERIKIRFWQIILLFSPAIIFLILSPTNLNVRRVWFESWGTNFEPGPLYYLLIIYIIIYFGMAFRNFFKNYRVASYVEGLQIKYIFWGFFGGVIIGLSTNAILPLFGYAQLSSAGPAISFISLVGFTTYAIVKNELFKVRLILTSLLVGGIAALLLIDIVLFTSQDSLKFLKGGVLIIFVYLGYSLIESVLREIRYRKELQKAYEELKVLDKAKSEFISMASHQLRTPLSAVKGYISMLLEGDYGQLPARARDRMRKISYSNERLIKIVADLLDVSRIELGKMELVKEKTQIEDLLESCYEEMKIGAEKKNLKFILKKPKMPLPELYVDSLKIRQIFLNLIDNAIKYTREGEIEIGTEKTDSTVRIWIKDTGEGLTAEEKGVIFESFARGSAGLALFIEGVGLGLYVAKKFIEMHKGKIWAESGGKGKGSTFYIELPIS